MGGQDDGAIIVWNIETKEPVCGSPAQHKSAGITYCLAASKEDEYQFYSAGKYVTTCLMLLENSSDILVVQFDSGNWMLPIEKFDQRISTQGL